MPLAGVRSGVEQFARRDAGGGVARHVADVVGAGALRAEAEVDDALDHLDAVACRDLAQLEVGAGGDVGVAAGEALGDVGHAGELPMLEDAVVDAEPAHVGVLRRRDVEQPVVAPAEVVGGLGELVPGDLLLELAVGVERVLLALPLLLVGELLAGLLHLGLRREVLGVRAARRGGAGRRGLRPQPIDVDPRGEAFEIALLLGREVAAHDHPRFRARTAKAPRGRESLASFERPIVSPDGPARIVGGKGSTARPAARADTLCKTRNAHSARPGLQDMCRPLEPCPPVKEQALSCPEACDNSCRLKRPLPLS